MSLGMDPIEWPIDGRSRFDGSLRGETSKDAIGSRLSYRAYRDIKGDLRIVKHQS